MGTRSSRRVRMIGAAASVVVCYGIVLIGAPPSVGLGVARSAPTAVTATNQPAVAPSTADLERQKLTEEIRQLRLANGQTDGWLGGFLPFAPFVTVLLAVGTLAAALWKQSTDLRGARLAAAVEAARWREDFTQQQTIEATKNEQRRQEFVRQQQLDRDNAQQEELGRFDETLSRISAQISSDNPGLSLNGAAARGLFVKPRYQNLHPDLLRITVANLKAKPRREVADLLCDELARVLAMLFKGGRPNPDVPTPLDLTHLQHIDLHGLTLPTGAVLDFAYATVDGANLSEMTINRVRGFEGSRSISTALDSRERS